MEFVCQHWINAILAHPPTTRVNRINDISTLAFVVVHEAHIVQCSIQRGGRHANVLKCRWSNSKTMMILTLVPDFITSNDFFLLLHVECFLICFANIAKSIRYYDNREQCVCVLCMMYVYELQLCRREKKIHVSCKFSL